MARERLLWADAIRAACVIAVVLMHLVSWVYLPESTAGSGGVWLLVSDYLTPVRMPVLFAVSGFITASRIRAGWSDPRLGRRVASSWYLYLVWLLVYAALSLVPASSRLPYRLKNVLDLGTQLVIPETTLWFVFALGVYVPLLASLRRVHPTLILAGLAALSIAIGRLPSGALTETLALRIPEYAFYFALGVYGAPLLTSLTERASVAKFAGASALYVAAPLVLKVPWLPVGWLAGVPLSTFAVLAAFAAAGQLDRWWPSLLKPAAAIGRRTLPIFLMHLPVIWLLMSVRQVLPLSVVPQLAWAAPVFSTALVVIICLTSFAAMRRTPLRILFDLPSRVERPSRTPTEHGHAAQRSTRVHSTPVRRMRRADARREPAVIALREAVAADATRRQTTHRRRLRPASSIGRA